MANSPSDRRLFDLLLEVASPALIIAMVSSLIFFLIEIFYRGPHGVRLNVIMALFTIATVLISRISIESGQQRAALFAIGLAIATFSTTSVIVEFQYQRFAWLESGVILMLIATVMWVSNRLVWDCTLMGPRRDVSAMGLTEVIRQKLSGRSKKKRKREVALTRASIPATDTLSVFEFMLGRNGSNSTPGLWVFYLSMAAFPVFGLGQLFYTADSTTFSILFLFAVYLASGLGLLMVTSLLGLRRYVSKRGVNIADAIAMNWLFAGGLFLAVFLVISFLLPRPNFSTSMSDYLVLFKSQTQTSKLAIGDDNEAQRDPVAEAKPQRQPQRPDQNQRPSPDAPQADGQGDDHSSNARSSATQTGRRDSAKPGQNKDSSNGPSKQRLGSKKTSDQPKTPAKARRDPNDAKRSSGDQRNAPAADNKNRPKGDADPLPQRGDNDQLNNDQPKNGEPDQGPPPERQNQIQKQGVDQVQNQVQNQGQRRAPPAKQISSPRLPSNSAGANGFVYVLVVVSIGVILVLYRDEIAKLYKALFEKPQTESPEKKSSRHSKSGKRERPFSSYQDPFATSTAGSMPPHELMDYTLQAIHAFAGQQSIDASSDLTVEELITAIADCQLTNFQSKDFGRFAAGFNRTIYGDGIPSKQEIAATQRIWRFMKSAPITAAFSQ